MKDEGRRAWLLSAAAYLVFMSASLSAIWLQQREPVWDAKNIGFPGFAFLGDALRSGRFPLWDPYTNCGYPFFADPSFSVTNPLALLLGRLVADPGLAFALFWCAHWILGGLGMLVVVFALGGSPAGGLVAAVLFATSGFFVGHAEHTPFIVFAASLPWAVGLAHLAVAERRADLALAACAALGMTALGSYPALLPIGGLFVAAWLALAFLAPGTERGDGTAAGTRARWVVGVVAAMAAVLALAASPMLYAFFREGAGYTQRVGALATATAVNDNPFPLPAWLTVVFPYVGVAAPRWIGTDVSMANGYCGILALPLAALWVADGSGRRRRWWLVALAVTFLLLSAGGRLGLRSAANQLLPFFGYLRHNGTLRLFWLLPVAAAAGCGASALARLPAARPRGLFLVASWGIVAVAAAFLAVHAVRVGGQDGGDVRLAFLFGPAALVLCAGIALLAFAVWSGRPTRWLALALAGLAMVDGSLHLHTNRMTVWEPPGVIRYLRSQPKPRRPEVPRAGLEPYGVINAHQVLGVPIAGGYVTMKSDFEPALLTSPFLTVLLGERYWLVPDTAAVPSRSAALEELRSSRSGEPMRVFAEEVGAGAGSRIVPGSFGEVRIASYEAERVELEVVVPTATALLASTERISAGWSAAVDGVEATPVRTNLFFRGVRVPEGRHRVTWRFDPGSFFVLLGTALAAVFGCAAASGLLYLRRLGARGESARSEPPPSPGIRQRA